MLESVALFLVLANPPEQTTLPRRPDFVTEPERERHSGGTPTDPYFQREFVATDDAAFILTAVESSRQGVVDARAAGEVLRTDALKSAATRIARQNEATAERLATLAKTKGWRLPEANPGRATTLKEAGGYRAHANFIVNQIAFHETTLAHFRAQLAGTKDPQLQRTLREAVAGYRKNLDELLTLKP